ncbi:ribosomal protein S18-alanine N-acetyltransferase [Kiloniella laminariae]|uniref:ribosomal protein S18-alanine N-acetyltransferase n=1 Tax=Kiloniella laminariae TaxID=454162 RepID=UPI00036029E5|nr:ribosomal protein S18-alanine N-acetyltransferase [Kiloniella laminariae]
MPGKQSLSAGDVVPGEMLGIEASHAEVLSLLHQSSFGEGSWSRDSFARILDLPTSRGLIYCVGKVPVGFVVWQKSLDEAEILTFCVDLQWRRKGISRLLIAEMLQEASQQEVCNFFLEVAADNYPAISLYLSSGFTEIGRRPKYYQREGGKSVDALVMQLENF